MGNRVPLTISPAIKWWLLAFASIAIFGNYYVYDAIAPLAEQLSSELGFTDTQIGSLNAIYSLPNILLVLIGGLLVDRFGAGRVAFYTALLCFVGAAISAGQSPPPTGARRLAPYTASRAKVRLGASGGGARGPVSAVGCGQKPT